MKKLWDRMAFWSRPIAVAPSERPPVEQRTQTIKVRPKLCDELADADSWERKLYDTLDADLQELCHHRPYYAINVSGLVIVQNTRALNSFTNAVLRLEKLADQGANRDKSDQPAK